MHYLFIFEHLKYNETTIRSCSLVAKQENFPLRQYKTAITDCDSISNYIKKKNINKNDLYVNVGNVQKRNKVCVLYNNQSVD